jgi:hypothetical protein
MVGFIIQKGGQGSGPAVTASAGTMKVNQNAIPERQYAIIFIMRYCVAQQVLCFQVVAEGPSHLERMLQQHILILPCSRQQCCHCCSLPRPWVGTGGEQRRSGRSTTPCTPAATARAGGAAAAAAAPQADC